VANMAVTAQTDDWRQAARIIAAHEDRRDVIIGVSRHDVPGVDDAVIAGSLLRTYYSGCCTILDVSRDVQDCNVLDRLVDEAVAGHQSLWLVRSHARSGLGVEHLRGRPDLLLTDEWRLKNVELARFSILPLSGASAEAATCEQTRTASGSEEHQKR